MSDVERKILPVVMCGGAGSRLWPVSRECMPKQFINMLNEHSLFQETVKRVAHSVAFDRPIVLTHSDSRFIVAEQLAEAGISADIILEPSRRDSAAAVAVAACYAARKSPRSIVLVMASDHVIKDPEAFLAACSSAAEGAELGYIMTLGLQPTHPATGYGYISLGRSIAGTGAYQVESFVEKPDQETASRYIESGYLWNSGYFLFRADTMLMELERQAPEILMAARQALEKAAMDLDFIRLDPTSFNAAPKMSIDYALMERTDKSGVLPVSFPWSDVGSWDAIWEISPQDDMGNAIRGKAEVLDARNCLVQSDTILTAVVGVNDIVVVTTPDAVLVTSREQSGSVKNLVSALKEKQYAEVDEHLRTYRPWGWYQRIDIGPRFHVKRIMVKPGGRLSLQKHFHRAEHWVVVRGTAEVTVDEKISLIHENEAIYVPIGSVHRLANPGRIPLELIEIQVGSYTGEDDIVRLEDVYGR